MCLLIRLAAILWCLILASGAAQAERRVALVIGNGAYRHAPRLPNPPNDATLVGRALEQAGFTVTVQRDLDHDGLVQALRAFGDDADGADWAVLYYAGHGMEIGGVNYLIPVDAQLATDRDVGFEAVAADQVMRAIEGARSLRMLILDACRNNPFIAAMKRSASGGRDIGRGLAAVEPTQATLVAYSAKAGTIASDGNGADSPFATALAAHLVEPGVEVDKVFRLVRDDVLDATGNQQEPFVYGSLPGRQSFYFVPPKGGAPGPDQALPVGSPPGAGTAEADYHAAEQVGTIAAWDAFLRKHGGETDAFYVTLAREARQKLADAPDQPKTPEPPSPAVDAASYSFVGPVGPPDPWLALRDRPSASQGQLMIKMPEGTLFEVLRQQGGWSYVRLRDGTEGWANSAWIQCCRRVAPAVEPAKVAYSYVGPVGPPDPWLALRDQPSASQGQRLMQMPEGTLFKVLRQQGTWSYVRLRDGSEGWANSGWIRCCRYVPE
jgi:uncharacterized caspase-like protein/SH3-like domain-containing protein